MVKIHTKKVQFIHKIIFYNIKQLHGKHLSYNNYNDIFAALTISKSLTKKQWGTVIVKHSNPCGVSILKNNVKVL